MRRWLMKFFIRLLSSNRKTAALCRDAATKKFRKK